MILSFKTIKKLSVVTLAVCFTTSHLLSAGLFIKPGKADAAYAPFEFTELATHPQAAAQSTDQGKTINTLKIFNGKLYAGYGDFNDNTGPIDINPFDLSNGTFDGVALQTTSESLGNWKVINGKLYTTTLDATCSGSCPSGYAVGDSNHTWEMKTPVNAEHIFDVETLTGTDIWLFGSSGGAAATAWRSTDNGDTWDVVQTHENEPGGDNTERYYWGAAMDGKMYMQSNLPGYSNPIQGFDGSDWSTGTTDELCRWGNEGRGPNPVVFDGKIVCSKGNQINTFDGTQVKEMGNYNSGYPLCFTDDTGLGVYDGSFYALCNDGSNPAKLVKSNDLNSFMEIDGVPANAKSFAIDTDANKIYIGTSDSKIMVADMPELDTTPPTVSLTSPSNGQNTSATTFPLSATASDSISGVERVEFYIGDTLISTDSQVPYTATWSNSYVGGNWAYPPGDYEFKAVAYDKEGNQGTSPINTVHLSSQQNLAIQEFTTSLANSTLAVDDDDNVWFVDVDFGSGQVAGINKLDANTGDIEEHAVPDGETFNAAFGVPMYYRQGKLWIDDCGSNAIKSYDVQTEQIDTYTFDSTCQDGTGSFAVTSDGAVYNVVGHDSINIVHSDGSTSVADFNDEYFFPSVTIDKNDQPIVNFVTDGDDQVNGIARFIEGGELEIIKSVPFDLSPGSLLYGFVMTSLQNGSTVVGGYPDVETTDTALLTTISADNSVTPTLKSVPATSWRLTSGTDNRTWFMQGNGSLGMLEYGASTPNIYGGLVTPFPSGSFGMPDDQIAQINEINLGWLYSGSMDVDSQNSVWVSDSIGGRILKVTVAGDNDPDSDADSIPDSIENGAPNNGDANGDGQQDSQQPNVASYTSTTSNGYVTVVVDDSCALVAAGSEKESELAVQDSGYNYPGGLLTFTADCGISGASTTVHTYFYNLANSAFDLRKYNANTHAFFSLVSQYGATIETTTIDGNKVVHAAYQLQDGSVLDQDGQANGVIVDPVGLATSTVGSPNTGLR